MIDYYLPIHITVLCIQPCNLMHELADEESCVNQVALVSDSQLTTLVTARRNRCKSSAATSGLSQALMIHSSGGPLLDY